MKIYIALYKSYSGSWNNLVKTDILVKRGFTSRDEAEKFAPHAHIEEIEVESNFRTVTCSNCGEEFEVNKKSDAYLYCPFCHGSAEAM